MNVNFSENLCKELIFFYNIIYKKFFLDLINFILYIIVIGNIVYGGLSPNS